ncbi:MAG: acyltransferase family protein, partial [Bacilli bacterium]
MPEPIKGSGRYMAGLDGLRALAVFAVIAYHLNLAWAPGGLLGVDVFFVLSGYLITDLLVAQWERSGRLELKDFWRRRARRLLPALLVMLVVVVAWITIFERAQLPPLRGDVVAAMLFVSNWWYTFHHVSYFARFGPPSPLGHLWSLAVEEQFYLLWPLALALGLRGVPRRRRLVWLTLASALASALAMALIYQPGVDPSRVYYGTDTRAFALLIGAALALVWPSRKLSATVSSRARLALDLTGGVGLLVVFFMIWRTNQYEVFLYRGGMVLLSVAAAAVVATLAHPASRLSRALGWKPLKWLGVRSYGIYLWHYPVIVLTSPAVN